MLSACKSELIVNGRMNNSVSDKWLYREVVIVRRGVGLGVGQTITIVDLTAKELIIC